VSNLYVPLRLQLINRAASNKEVIHDHEETIISAVRTALVDPSSVVRAAAAKTFDTMQHYMGAKAIDQTIPTLLEAMRNPGEGSETALQALQEVMSVSDFTHCESWS
jgi:hypothetical protein